MDTLNRNKLILEQLSSFISISLAFLMPVFFLSTTTEFFEFNKLALLVVATILLVIFWGIRVLLGKELEIVKTAVDLPLFAYIIVFVLSTIFSVNKTISIFGSQGRWFPSLFALVVISLYYYISTPNLRDLNKVKTVLLAFIAGLTINTLVAILSFYNIFVGSELFFKTINFSLAGSVTTTILLAAVGAVLTITLLVNEKLVPAKILLITSLVINFFFVALTSSLIGWALLIIGMLASLFFTNLMDLPKQRITFAAVLGVLVAVTLLTQLPATKSILKSKAYPFEITLGLRESWVVAAGTIQDYPLLATGPSTFLINFTRYKPLSMNSTDVWGVRFDKPQNEFFNVLATMGIIGTLSYLFLLTRLGKFALVSKGSDNEQGLSKILAIGLIMMVASMFLTYATILNTFVMFMFVSLLAATASIAADQHATGELVSFSFSSLSAVTTTIGEASAVKKEYMNLILVAPLIAATAFGGYLFYKNYLGEYYMRQSVLAAVNNQASQTYDFQSKAININPGRDSYHTAYAQTNLVLANALAAKPDLTDEDKQTIQTLVAQSIRSSRIVTEVVNPLGIENWQTRALIYRSLVNVADNASEWAIGSYNTAIQLDPTNPTLRLDLGGVYYANKEFLSAANLFRQATTLKNDYANAHYNFAQALKELNDPENAKRELEVTKTLVVAGSDDYKKVEAELALLNSAAAEVAGATTAKPSVEQITGPEVSTATQEPLRTPSQTDSQNLNVNSLPQPTTQPATTQPAR